LFCKTGGVSAIEVGEDPDLSTKTLLVTGQPYPEIYPKKEGAEDSPLKTTATRLVCLKEFLRRKKGLEPCRARTTAKNEGRKRP